MSHSVSPLGSLSSPSPSPSPPPNPIDESELSELTDDDHDQNAQVNTHTSLSDNDDDQHSPPRSRKSVNINARQKQCQHLQRKSLPTATYTARSSAPSSSKRKKRGGLVPAPMWDWAYKNGTAESLSSTPTPAHCLSPPPNSTPGPSRPIDADSDPGTRPPKPKSPSATPDAEEEEEEEFHYPPRAMEEEEGEEGDPRKDRPLDRKHPQRKSLVRFPAPRKRVVVPMPFDRSKVPRSKRGVKVMPGQQHDMMLKSLWERGYKVYDPNAPTSDEESDQHDDQVLSEDDDHTPSPSPAHSDDGEMEVDEDVEIQDPTPFRESPLRPTLTTHLKPSPPPCTSAIDPVTDNHFIPPSNRASVDPTASPPDEDVHPVVIPDEDIDRDHYPDALDDDDHHPAPDGDVEADGDEDEEPQPDEPSQPSSPTPLAEHEPEPEPEDEDPDLQPAHRAEALDVLATIELKFALLRERVYVEKMEGLAWEEALVWDGAHPELHYLQNELTKRRDKRLLLASKKRVYEIEALTRKRHEEEIWCWEGWDIARTELQTEMIAETNRKRRKLERERRTVERPPGARRIPNAILNPPPAPTLRQIANTFPLPSHLLRLTAHKKLSNAKSLGIYPGPDGLSGVTAYPDLPTLSPHDVAADLEFLFQHRRIGYGFGMGFGPPVGVPIGVGVGYNSTTSGLGPTIMGFGGSTPTQGFGVNGLGIGGPAETYPPNPGPGIGPGGNATHNGVPPLGLGGSGPGLGPLAPPLPSTGSSQIMANSIAGPVNIPGAGIANADGPSFSQPAMGIFQGPPSIGTGPTAYHLGPGVGGARIVIGPGGATSTPVVGPGGARIQRPSGFVERERELQRDRERELIQRDRELTSRDRELAAQREREMRDRDREREFGPNMGPGYPAWGSKPAGGIDWGVGDARRREERERIERNERDRERERPQAQPIVPTPTHRHLHQHPHTHSHTHQLQQHPIQSHQPHIVHANQSHPHQHPQHLHSHVQHPHQHTQYSHAPPHHHVGQHHHHRHHHHVVHNHHPGASPSGPDGAPPLLQGPGPTSGVQTMEIINLSANPASKSHWKRDEAKLGGSGMPGSRPPSTHPLPPSHNYDEREKDRERDRPIATPFVLAPSHHTISSAASSPRHGWTPGPGESGSASSSVPSAPFSHPPERFHTPVPHRFSNPTPNGLSQLPRPLTTSPPRAPPTSVLTTSPSISTMNVLPSSSSPAGPFPRKPSPALPKLGMPLGYSPRLTGPGVVPPTGPGVPGVLSTTSSGPGVTPSGILTSGPGVPPGPGIAPAPIVGVGGPGESSVSSLFATTRTTSPVIPYAGAPPIVAVPTQKVGVDGP